MANMATSAPQATPWWALLCCGTGGDAAPLTATLATAVPWEPVDTGLVLGASEQRLGNLDVRKRRMILINASVYEPNGDPFSRLHILSLDGFQVGIGTIRTDGP